MINVIGTITRQINKTQELIDKKVEENKKKHGLMLDFFVYGFCNDERSQLQIKCLKELLSLLTSLQGNFSNRHEICNKIIDLARGNGKYKMTFYVCKYFPTEYAAMEGIYSYVPPENGFFYDRTARRFCDVRKIVEGLLIKDTELDEVPNNAFPKWSTI